MIQASKDKTTNNNMFYMLGALNALFLAIIGGAGWRMVDKLDDTYTTVIRLETNQANLEKRLDRYEARAFEVPFPAPSVPNPGPAPTPASGPSFCLFKMEVPSKKQLFKSKSI